MAKNKKPDDDLQRVGQPGEITVEVLADRLGLSHLIHTTDLYDVDEFPIDEPVEMVDAPVPLQDPLPRKQKHRNQRR